MTQSGIDIITTKQCIRKHQRSRVVTVPFLIYDQKSYLASSIYSIYILSAQETIIPVHVKIKDVDTIIFTSSKHFIEQKKRILILNSLLKIEYRITRITIINANESSQYLNINMSFSTNSFPSLTSISLSLLPIQQIETYARHNLKCHTYHEQYTSNKQLFEYLYESDHYGKHIINVSFQQLELDMLEKIKQQIESLLIIYIVKF
ncbi:unnamed protein product [Rotaria sordida]|uniref:Uncharacterized protein n=2 Tax=Rotaria sordida TaxID=392033 RepID=A0A820E8Y6_9BILA|nr:unnamed protein product [Rotaria sordida]